MKKVIIACLALFSLVSCSNNASEQEQPVRTAATEAATAELTPETEIPPATEPITVNKVIYEDDNLTITYNRFESLSTVQKIYFTFDNNSNYYVRAIAEDIKINGIAIDQKFSTELESKNSVSPTLTILNSKLQNENITKVNSLEFKMQITVSDLTSRENVDSYYTDIMTITR